MTKKRFFNLLFKYDPTTMAMIVMAGCGRPVRMAVKEENPKPLVTRPPNALKPPEGADTQTNIKNQIRVFGSSRHSRHCFQMNLPD